MSEDVQLRFSAFSEFETRKREELESASMPLSSSLDHCYTIAEQTLKNVVSALPFHIMLTSLKLRQERILRMGA